MSLTDEELTAFEAEAAHWPKSNALAVSTLLLAADLRELREAVGPFAGFGRTLREGWIDEARFDIRSQAIGVWLGQFSAGDLRRLAACLPKRGE